MSLHFVLGTDDGKDTDRVKWTSHPMTQASCGDGADRVVAARRVRQQQYAR